MSRWCCSSVPAVLNSLPRALVGRCWWLSYLTSSSSHLIQFLTTDNTSSWAHVWCYDLTALPAVSLTLINSWLSWDPAWLCSKGKVNHAPQESVGGCSSPSSRPSARRWRTTNFCDAWPVRRQTYNYLPSHKAGTILYCLVTRGTCVNLRRVALNSRAAGIWTCGICKSSTLPLYHKATHVAGEVNS